MKIDNTSDLEKMTHSDSHRELEESKERYRNLSRFLESVLNSITEYAIIAVGGSGLIAEFNRGAENIFGWEKAEVVGKHNISVTQLPTDISKGIQADIVRRVMA